MEQVTLKHEELSDVMLAQVELMQGYSNAHKLMEDTNGFSYSELKIPFVVVGEESTKKGVTTLELRKPDGTFGWAFSDTYFVFLNIDRTEMYGNQELYQGLSKIQMVIPTQRLKNYVKKRIKKEDIYKDKASGSKFAKTPLEELQKIAINKI